MSQQTGRSYRDEIAALFVLAVLAAPVIAALPWGRLATERAGTAAGRPRSEQGALAGEPLALSETDRQYLMTLLIGSLTAHRAAQPPPELSGAPETCRRPLNLEVFVTLYAPGHDSLRASARKSNLAQSTLAVAGKLADRGRFGPRGGDSRGEGRVRFDIVIREQYVPPPQRDLLSLTVPGAPIGFSLMDGETRHVFLPGDVAESRAGGHVERLRELNTRAGGPPRGWRDSARAVAVLRTVSFVNDAPGSARCLPTVRGLPLAEEVSLEQARTSHGLAGRHLVRMFELPVAHVGGALDHRDENTFAVRYDALTGSATRARNVSEQAQAAAALARFCARQAAGPPERALSACRRSLVWLLERVHVPRRRADVAVVLGDGEAAPGKAGLQDAAAVLAAFCEYRGATGDDTWDDLIERLANFLLFLQSEDGSFRPDYDLAADAARGSGESAGEAVQAQAARALALAYRERRGETRLLLGSQRALMHLSESDPTAADPEAARRFVAALREVSAFVPANPFLPRLRGLVGELSAAQLSPGDAPAPDLAGGVLRGYPPPVGETAADLEAFAGAWLLLSSPEDPQSRQAAQASRRAALRAARYVRQFQYLPENAYYLRTPRLAVGGVRELPGSNVATLWSARCVLDGMDLLAQALTLEAEEGR